MVDRGGQPPYNQKATVGGRPRLSEKVQGPSPRLAAAVFCKKWGRKMKYLKQATLILLISFAGEVLNVVLPLPIPASVYGMVILLVCLCTGLVRVGQVKETAGFLIEIMPVMFIPAAVGLTDAWPSLQPVLVPVTLTMVLTTVLVMAVTGWVTQGVIHKEKGAKK